MASYKVEVRYDRTVSFYVEADDEDALHDFMNENPDWDPRDIRGLVESDESVEEEYGFKQTKFTANWKITEEGDLMEKDS